MSSDWPNVELGDCIELVTGFPFKSAKYTDAHDAIRLLRGDNVGQGALRWEGAKMWPPEDSRELANYELSESDVVLAMDRPWIPAGLKFARVRKSDLPALLVQRVARFRPKDCIRADYLYSVIGSREFTEYIQSVTTGTAVPHISATQIRDFRFKLPDIRTQELVGQFLANLDDRIALLRDTNATLEAIAQALFKSWFVDFDPVRAKQEGRAPEGMDEACAELFPNGFEESELGLVPKGWHVSDLADLLANCGGTIQTGPFGSQLHAADYVESGIPVVMPKDIQRRRVDATTTARIRPEDADRLKRHKLKPGDIVFSRRGDVERHALIGEREVGWLCGTGCLLVRPGPSFLSSSFLSMTLDAPRARQWLVQHAVGATMPNLNTSILGSVPLILPDAKVLGIFEDIVSATEAQLTQNSELANTLSSIRDTLLPRLISGQLRLSEAEALVA